LKNWIQKGQDRNTDEQNVASVDEITAIVSDFSSFLEELEAHRSLVNELHEIADKLSAYDVTVNLDSIQTFEETIEASKAKKAELESQVDYQKDQDAHTSAYISKATEFNAKFDSIRGLLNIQNDTLEVAVEKTTDAVAQCLDEKDAISGLESTWVLLDEGHRATTVFYETLVASFKTLTENSQAAKDNALKVLLAKSESNISPEDLKEFRETFDHFDKNKNGTLNALDFYGVLTALGETPTEESAAGVFNTIDRDGSGQINFEEFSKYMIAKRKDTDSQSQLTDSFTAITGGADFVTEDQLKLILPSDSLSKIISIMPLYVVDGNPIGYDYKAWLSAAYN